MNTTLKKRKAALASVAIAAALVSPAAARVTAGIQNDEPGALHGSPIQVESCLITPSLAPAAADAASAGAGYLGGRLANPWVGAAVAIGGTAAVATVAQNPRLVVRLGNGGAGADVFVRDETIIRPGDVVVRKYAEGKALGGGYAYARAVQCDVDFVRFADGTTWSDPATYRKQAR